MAALFPAPTLSQFQKSVTPELLQRYQSLKTALKDDTSRGTSVVVATSKSGMLVGLKGKQGREDVKQKRTLSEERTRNSSVMIVNVHLKHSPCLPSIVPPASSSRRLPPLSYQSFRSDHLQRNNSTSPSKRRYADHSIGGEEYNPADAAIKMYHKQTIRLTARSKVVIHAYFPPFQSPGKAAGVVRRRKTQKTALETGQKTPKSAETAKNQPFPTDFDEPIAVTYGDKLVKVQKAFNEAFSSRIN